MEELPVLPPPATLEPISRPSSASTTASQKESLPGISAIAAAAAAAAAAVTSSPHLRYVEFPGETASCRVEWSGRVLSDPRWDVAGEAGSVPSSPSSYQSLQDIQKTALPGWHCVAGLGESDLDPLSHKSAST